MSVRSSLFRRHLIASIIITSIFVSALGVLSLIMIRQFRRESAAPFSSPAVIFAKLLHSIPKNKRTEALNKIVEGESRAQYQFWLLNDEGAAIYPPDALTPPIDWNKVSKPDNLFDFKNIEGQSPLVFVQIDEKPAAYLLVRFHGRPNGSRMFYINLFSLIIAVILGTTLSFFVLFYSLRQKANLADSIISELQKGNLKARFPITKMDEVGRAMLRFNKMADEIERLVERLKATEKSRMLILQELAHDLRTPVASLRNLLDTLLHKSDVMEASLRVELTSLSLKEVDYFENLVEDLLFLAQATEPGYNLDAKSVNFSNIIEEEIESAEKVKAINDKATKIKKDLSQNLRLLKGDSHLLRRMIRNALDNAISFASKTVTVRTKNLDDGRIQCIVEDDGPGFSPESLKEFGKRKLSRKYVSSNQRRASIGLGSVIMAAAATLHRGQLNVENKVDGQGQIIGGVVRITIPS